MALDVLNDSRSEHHRNWVSSTVVQALGVRIDNGLWVLPKPGRHRARDLDRPLAPADPPE